MSEWAGRFHVRNGMRIILIYACVETFIKNTSYRYVLQVKLNLSMLDGIQDDADFCMELAKQESMIILPGMKWSIFILLFIYLFFLH